MNEGQPKRLGRLVNLAGRAVALGAVALGAGEMVESDPIMVAAARTKPAITQILDSPPASITALREILPDLSPETGELNQITEGQNFQMAQRIAELINEARVKNGKKPLKTHLSLTAAAENYAQFLFNNTDRRNIGHDLNGNLQDRLEREAYEGWGSGEVLSAVAMSPGYIAVASYTVESWMRNPDHRNTLLAEQANEIGVGCYQGLAVICVVDFGVRELLPVEKQLGNCLDRTEIVFNFDNQAQQWQFIVLGAPASLRYFTELMPGKIYILNVTAACNLDSGIMLVRGWNFVFQ